MFTPRRTLWVTLGLFAIGLAIGGACTFFIRDAAAPDGGPGAAAQPDPCYGHGELLYSWTYIVGTENLESAEEPPGPCPNPG